MDLKIFYYKCVLKIKNVFKGCRCLYLEPELCDTHCENCAYFSYEVAN
jgi:hypothetical protein